MHRVYENFFFQKGGMMLCSGITYPLYQMLHCVRLYITDLGDIQLSASLGEEPTVELRTRVANPATNCLLFAHGQRHLAITWDAPSQGRSGKRCVRGQHSFRTVKCIGGRLNHLSLFSLLEKLCGWSLNVRVVRCLAPRRPKLS